MSADSALVLGTLATPLARAQTEIASSRLTAIRSDLAGAITVLPGPVGPRQAEPFLAVPAAAVVAQEERLLAGECDLLVVAAVDLVLPLPEGVTIAAVLERSTPFDGLVNREGLITEELAERARVGVLNLRTRVQVRALWPHLRTVQVGGGIDGALEGLLRRCEVEALVLPAAPLEHLGMQSIVPEMFNPEMVLPSAGQGILTLLARSADPRLPLLQALHSQATHLEMEAEHAFAQRFASDQDLPVAALARVRSGRLTLDGAVLSTHGAAACRDQVEGPAAEARSLGEQLAEKLLMGGDAVMHLLEADFPDGLPALEEDPLPAGDGQEDEEAGGADDLDELDDYRAPDPAGGPGD